MSNDVWALPEHRRLADETFHGILRAVYAGELTTGSRLSVPALAERFGISRTPVREAIQRLVREGLATEEVNRGATLIDVSIDRLVHMYEIREVLEGMAARYAAERATDAEIADLGRTLARHHDAVDRDDDDAHFELDTLFHRQTRLAARNPELIEALDRIQAKVRLAMLTTVITRGKESAVAEHDEIFAALEDRDPSRAEQLARQHVEGRRIYLTTTYQTEPIVD